MTTATIRIHPADNVVIARIQLVGGTVLPDEGVTVAGLVPPGHKVATRPIAAGEEITIDYDTFFTKEDVETLFAMAMTFQCDAITGLQTKREDGRPMLTLKGTLDNPPDEGHTSVPTAWFAEPVQEVDTAHFGCTVISTAALKRAKKPWFWSKPDPQGGWGDGRVDPDIAFWKTWRESGNRVFVSPRVVLGHGEYVVTWPGKNLTAPVFQWTTEFTNTGKRPESAWSVP